MKVVYVSTAILVIAIAAIIALSMSPETMSGNYCKSTGECIPASFSYQSTTGRTCPSMIILSNGTTTPLVSANQNSDIVYYLVEDSCQTK